MPGINDMRSNDTAGMPPHLYEQYIGGNIKNASVPTQQEMTDYKGSYPYALSLVEVLDNKQKSNHEQFLAQTVADRTDPEEQKFVGHIQTD